MTEAEWAACHDPRQLLDYHRMKRDPRRLRLLAVACARLIPPTALPPQLGPVIDVAERFADGTAPRAEFLAARRLVRAAGRRTSEYTLAHRVLGWLADDSLEGQSMAITVTRDLSGPGGAAAECDLTRCAFGNPFRTITFDPVWRTEAVVGLATGVAADRAFDRLPVLADALEDAGCADADVLGHCRGPGPHALCCWVVDGVLGKSAQSGT
ncbi:hypothetical protein [Urbifossiella limnaea]|uniref:Uncharacterized protein n=1 Tax=Urbifossiella limnaea TaxID=2528023 RepID=A0A517Y002_9BACT|nr:hypothetical protein [Urbifossiella limnaea]QDU23087.1 hypothetical protein ETAA1_50780 [Urbifossiella limnaea]